MKEAVDSVIGWEVRSRHVRAASSIGLVFGLLFAAFNMLTPGLMALGLAEGLAELLLVVPALILSRSPRYVGLAESLLLLSAGVIFGALIVFGGIEGTGLYWVYVVPFLAFFLKGERQGWMFSVAFLLVAAAYFLLGGPTLAWAYHYTPVTGSHFVLSLLFYTLVAAAFNHVRSRYEAQLAQGKDEAEAASLAKSRFLAAASHDLRQPAHAMGMFVARLGQLSHDAVTRELVVGVNASVRALQEMLDAFFDYSRLDAPSMQVSLADFPVNQLLDQLRTSFEAMAEGKGLRLRIRPSSIWLRSDPVLLHRVLLNLVSNAVQHTHQGTVLVTCRPACGHTQARLEVWDSGVGIAPEHHASVFQEFFQVDNPQRDRAKGMGLGLSLVERACRLLNHPVTLRSAVGCGTRFGVLVPMAAALPAMQRRRGPRTNADLSGLQVLLIEDDVLGGVAMAGLLQSWGCRVVVAVDAASACALARQSPDVDVVVSDYRLPGPANGILAIGQLRDLLGRPLPACVISGDMDASAHQQAQAAGLTWLQKPVRPAKLRSVLRHAAQASAVKSLMV
ncbi:ATP-binding protein [Rhodoferax sp.]|uniref:ATP-binding response regulator n=1 Tax=Rhodoferax sp. TaxID=50421 RepID=UPI002840BA1E|nr:ATP-binding protein [Rhodoferax sp.]MDR3371291.1 ATP-binding protein [Rhodoferax sp.]